MQESHSTEIEITDIKLETFNGNLFFGPSIPKFISDK